MTLRAYGALFGVRHGEGPLQVLALHGWGRTRADFDGLLQGYEAIALDLPGFGASPAPEHPVGAAGYAGLIEDVLGEFDAPPVVVGHSFGGRVAVALAAALPDAVSGLVLVGVPLVRRERPAASIPWRYRLIRSARKAGLISDERLERARRRFGSADYRAATGVMRDVLVKVVNESYESELARLTCPVRLVWGADDAAVPPAVARSAVDAIADVTLDVVAGAGHDVHLSHPDRLRAAIDGLLK
ncbi:MAG TPA: alpha/beta hydrolase [Acidimicrobiia bacterium]|nr:alpha/beta hydrolase [Acidimicrobiia bacterium]